MSKKALEVGGGLFCQEQGAGGVRSLSTLNKALMNKWIWCFAVEREALGRKLVISTKY